MSYVPMQPQAAQAEAQRLEALRKLAVLDSPAEPPFDRLVALAAHLFRAPVALLSLVDERRQWFKARVGTALAETPREHGLCAHAILEPRVFSVPDASRDERFAEGALVRGDATRPPLRFYAGAPLILDSRHRVGTLCILDHAPRAPLTAAEEQTLRELAGIAVDELELRGSRRPEPPEQKQLEPNLLLADRLAAMGTLAAGVAHEINNPLAFVISNLGFVTERLALLPDGPLLPELSRAAREAREGAERISQSVRDLRALSRDEEPEARKPIDVRQVLDSCLQLASGELRERAQITRTYRPVPEVLSSQARLAQIFLNLILNAAWSIPEGAPGEASVSISTLTDAQGRAVVIIADTGQGLAPEQLARLFEPFSAARPQVLAARPLGRAMGSGLGLAICHGAVLSLGGEIFVESAKGKGSTFRIALPPARAAVAPQHAPDEPQPSEPRRARILVVDDEPMVGLAVERALRTQHEVTLTQSAREALRRMQAGERFDLILCDVMMPEMSGIELEASVRALDEEQSLRMVFLTGGAFTKKTQEFLERMQERVLEKPFGVGDLRSYVSRKVGG